MTLKFCPKCGSELVKEEEDFCPYCGSDLRKRKSLEKEIVPPKYEVIPARDTHAAMPVETKKPEKKKTASDQYAGFLPRFAAWLIDSVLIFVIFFVFAIFLNRLGPALLIILILIIFFYNWILEVINDGQTIGKMALKLRTVNAKSLGTASAGDYIINNLLKCNPLLILDLILGILVNINDPKKRKRIMQNASDTIVVRTFKK